MQERRNAERRLAEGDLFVFDHHSDEPLGRIGDLTTKGLMLRCSAPVREGKIYTCRMALPEEVLGWTEIKFQTECKWCMDGSQPGEIEAGFEFKDIGEKEQLIIALLIAPWDALDAANAVLAASNQIEE